MKQFLMLAALVVGGCAKTSGGESVAIYRWNTQPVMVTAPLAGRYVLIAAGEEEPRAEVDLKQGEPLGFKPGSPGTVSAVAGGKTFKVGDVDMVWRRK